MKNYSSCSALFFFILPLALAEDAMNRNVHFRGSLENSRIQFEKNKKGHVAFIVWHDPLMTAGSGTFQNELIGKAGGINVARDLIGWVTISLEVVIQANPEVMIASFSYVTGEDLSFQVIKEESRLGSTDARQNGRVYGIDESVISRPGPRIVEALELLAQMIHPEIFHPIE